MSLMSVVGVCGLLVGLILAYRSLRRVWVFVVVFGAAVVVLAVRARAMDLQWFTWAKIAALIVACAVLIVLRRRPSPVWRAALVGILVLNMAEAMVADAMTHCWVNVAVGAFLCACIPGPGSVSAICTRWGSTVGFPLTASWIAQYTLWDLNVVVAHYPLHWFDHAAVLSAPILTAVILRDARVYLEARAFTLAAYAVTVVCAIDAFGLAWIPSVPVPRLFYPVVLTLTLAFTPWTAWAAWRSRVSPRNVAPTADAAEVAAK